MKRKQPGWLARTFCQASGKLRRFVINRLRPKYVVEALGKRSGECVRCGACCRLLFKCPFLKFDKAGLAECAIYRRRPINCRIFPLDARDIRERDMVAGAASICGYALNSPAVAATKETAPAEAAD